MTDNILSKDIPDLHSYLRWNSISKFIDYNLSTLDVGCNIGTMTLEIAKRSNSHIVGVDIDLNCLQMAAKRANIFSLRNCEFLFGNATLLPFPNGSFEQILLADILEHVVNDNIVIEECFRVLKPGGKLIMNLPRPNYSQLFNPDWIHLIGHVRDGYELIDIDSLISEKFVIDHYEFNSRAREELDAFYNKGQHDLTDQRIEALLAAEEDVSQEAYGLTISATRIGSGIINDPTKPRILHVGWGHPPHYGGGPVYYLQNLCLQQQSKGMSVSCFVAGIEVEQGNGNIPVLTQHMFDGVVYDFVENRPAHYFDWDNPDREVQNFDIEKLFYKKLEEVHPAIVHFHNLIGLSMSLPEVAKKFGCVTIFSVHNYWMICTRDDLFATNETICSGPRDGARCASCVSNDKLNVDFMRRTATARKIFTNSIDAISAVSEKVKKILEEFGVDGRKIFVQHIGSKAADDNWAQMLSFNCDRVKDDQIVRFGFLGSVTCRKGPHIILEAVEKLGKLTSNFEVRIHGYCPPGSYENRLKLMIQASDILKKHVRFMGVYKQDQIFDIAKSLDIAIIPPIWEDNAPQTVMETLASGLPIIGSNIGGIPDFVKHGRNGLLFKAGDADELCESMLKVIEDNNLLVRLHQGLEAPLAMNTHVVELLELYEQMVRNHNVSDSAISIPREDVFAWDTSSSFQHLNEAERLIGENDFSGASKQLSVILRFEPHNCYALNDFVVISLLTGDYTNAASTLQLIMSLDPLNETAQENWKYLRQKLIELGEPEESISEILPMSRPNYSQDVIQEKVITKFRTSALAIKYCVGKGLEIGASAHNPFGLDTLNVDATNSMNTCFKEEELRLCGEAVPVDIVASGDDIPLPDKSQDFIISSHVFEHFPNPIKALLEWDRIVKPNGIIFFIVPHKERTFDKDRTRTTLEHLVSDYQNETPEDIQNPHQHYHCWITEDVVKLIEWMQLNMDVQWKIEEVQDVDDKVGNGFTIVIRKLADRGNKSEEFKEQTQLIYEQPSDDYLNKPTLDGIDNNQTWKNFSSVGTIPSGKINIGFLANDYSSACPMIRVISVLHTLQKMQLINFVPLINLPKLKESKTVNSITEIINTEELRKLDILIIQREFCITVPFDELKKLLEGTDVQIIFEIDDNLLNLYPGHSLYETYKANRKYFHDYLAHSDLVTVTTRELKNAFSDFTSRITVLPNYLDEEIWKNEYPRREVGKKVRILFSGSKTHLEDLALIEDVIVAISKEYKDKIEFVFWGDITNKIVKKCKIEKITEFIPSYAAYAKRLSSLNIDIGLIPLADNEFNRSKSSIKYLDYSGAGIASIMSNVEAYNEIVTDGINGILTENNFDSWYNSLKLLIDDSFRRNIIAQNAFTMVMSNFTIQKNAYKWFQIYTSLIKLANDSNNPKISIIVLTYNALEYTKKFYQSLLASKAKNYELIIIDNSSTDETPAYLRSLSTNENIKIILNATNNGFPAAVNQGIIESKGKYIIVANNDIVFTDGWLERMIQVAESDPKIGLVGPISNEVSGLQIDKDAAYNSIDEMHAYAEMIRSKNKGEIFHFPRIAFLCTLIKREVIDKIGGLDERFSPGNYEDDDFCLRAQLAGYKTVIAKDVFIHHYGSKSFKANGEKKYAERLEVNKQKFIAKWGVTPDELWLQNKTITPKQIMFPINKNKFIQFFDRSRIQIADKEYFFALESLNFAIENYNVTDGEKLGISLEDLLYLAGNISLAVNELDLAKNYFEQGLNINPNSSSACVGLGEIFFLNENFQNAKVMFEWGVKNDETNNAAIESLVKVNSVLGLEPLHNSLYQEV